MTKRLNGLKVAILVSNGFCENDLTETQRHLQQEGAKCNIISLDHGVVNGWHENGWGHHFMVDNPLSSALAADYSMLVLPGGRRSLDKLKLTAHTRRFIGGFMTAGKPVAACGRALCLMIYCDQVKGKTVSGPEDILPDAVRAGANWSDDPVTNAENLVTGRTDQDREGFIRAMIENFSSYAAALPKAA